MSETKPEGLRAAVKALLDEWDKKPGRHFAAKELRGVLTNETCSCGWDRPLGVTCPDCRRPTAASEADRATAGEREALAFYAEHYADWQVYRLPLVVYVPMQDATREDALELVQVTLDEGAWDMRVYPATPPADDASATDPGVARVARELLETDALTGNHDGTPEWYTVNADDVEHLVRTVLDLYFPAEHDAPESEWTGPVVEQQRPADDTPDATASEPLSEAEERESVATLADKWGQASDAARRAEHHWPADCLAEAALTIVTMQVEKSAAVAAAATRARAEGAAAERERIAKAIEAERNRMASSPKWSAFDRAARIARGDS